jgi:carboxyl-terminal processing protease
MTDFAFNFVDQHRKEMTNKWTLDHFIERFDQDDRVFQSYLSKIHVEADSHNQTAKEALRTYLKASIANELFGDIGSYRIIHKKDKMLERVLELDSKVE